MFDVIIIGAGPSGLFSVFQAGMMGLNCAVIDTLSSPGGQCNALYPEKPIYDIPGHPRILAQELIDLLHKQIEPFKPTFFLEQQALSINQNEDQSFTVTTAANNKIGGKTIIVAAGGGSFGPNRPVIKNILEFENKSIFYSITKQEIFHNKKIVIAGGGDSAIDWSLSLSGIASKIYLIHRRNKFKATPESMKKINTKVEESKIELVIPYQLHKIHGENGRLNSIEVINFDNNTKLIEADYLLLFFGLSMNIGPILDWGIDIENKHIKVDLSTMQTNIKGIFAVGDIITYPGKLKLILSGFAEAARACHSAYSIINNGTEIHFEYSTTKGVPTK
ncbi:MAG: NAD(P)/FAD-dependent oxidoreductase [Candidatus Midichloria sp.]|nr:MAG: NAD(P)/FAD-dependent oxidoreductase [Candidatus Midichloria sp.]